VSVARDPSDVTHIKAQSPRDAWFALGYVHAQERGWQLEFNRRVMHGELSEVFGPATLETDKLLRTLGVVRAAERQWQTLPAEGRDAMQAYSEGISAFYAGSPQALPPEFHIVGTRPGGASGAAWSPVRQPGLVADDGAGPGRQLGHGIRAPVRRAGAQDRRALAIVSAVSGRATGVKCRFRETLR
jgi:acyl-homoserine lactone acylase PvdQ